jgi:hypothetical protein
MPITVVASGKFAQSAVATTRTVTLPTVQAGDYLLIETVIPSNTGTITPSGLDGLIEKRFQGYSGHRHSLWERENLTAAESGTVITFTTSASYKVAGTWFVFRGVPATAVIDVSAGVNGPTGSSLTVTSPILTTTAPEAVEIQFVACAGAAGVTSFTPETGAGLTVLQEAHDTTPAGGAGGSTHAVAAWNSTPQPVGAVPGDTLWTINATNLMSAFTVAIKPATVSTGTAPIAPSVITTKGYGVVMMAAGVEGEPATAWDWSQTEGPAVTAVGAGQTRSFIAPPSLSAAALKFRVRAMQNGAYTPYSTITVNVAPHRWWTVKSGSPVALVIGEPPVIPADPEAPPPVEPPPPVDPPPPPPVTETATPGLFFKLPANIRSHPKKIFGHYFGPYPRSIDNAAPANDYYHRNFLHPAGEANRKLASGGLLRDRPLPTDPKGTDWRKQNARTEIQWAIDAGIDGMFCDLLGLTGQNWDNYMALRDAAIQYFPGFYVIPMIDANGAHGTATAAQNANSIAQFANRASSYYVDGNKLLVGSFRTEGKTQQWWLDVFNAAKANHNIDVSFVSVFLNYASQGGNYLTITDIGSTWGMGSDPGVISKFSNVAATARSRGQKWMQPIQPQNIRPNQFTFDEALGTGSLRAGWARAVKDNADYIQLVTWSDFSEGGQTVPSVQSGYVNVDLCAYYMTQWKTGVKPTILKDAIYLSHRNQLLATTPAFVSTSPMTQRAQTNRTTAADIVEVLTFFTAPATVTVNIGANVHTYTAPAGEYPQTFPMVNGAIKVTAVRSGNPVATVTSPIGCMASPPVQDRGYYRFSSLRPTSTYYVPSHIEGL